MQNKKRQSKSSSIRPIRENVFRVFSVHTDLQTFQLKDTPDSSLYVVQVIILRVIKGKKVGVSIVKNSPQLCRGLKSQLKFPPSSPVHSLVLVRSVYFAKISADIFGTLTGDNRLPKAKHVGTIIRKPAISFRRLGSPREF